MKLLQTIAAVFLFSVGASAITYGDYQKLLPTIKEARYLFERREYTKALNKYLATHTLPYLSNDDKLHVAYCYASIGNEKKLRETLDMLQSGFFLRNTSAKQELEYAFQDFPAKTPEIKSDINNFKAKVLAAEQQMERSKTYVMFRDRLMIDQAVRNNVLDDAYKKYSDTDDATKAKIMYQYTEFIFRYVSKNGWPGFDVAGNYPEMLAVHDRANTKFYTGKIIEAAEKGNADWLTVENMLLVKEESVKQFEHTWDHRDTIMKYVFDEDCQVREQDYGTISAIADSFLKYKRMYKAWAVECYIVEDSSYYQGSKFESRCDFIHIGNLLELVRKSVSEKTQDMDEQKTMDKVFGLYCSKWTVYSKHVLANYGKPSYLVLQYANK